MLLTVPIRLITDNDKANQIFNKLPIDVQDYLVNYSDTFQKKVVVPLLECSEVDFPKKFAESAGHLGNYIIQIGSFLDEKQKTFPNIMNDLIEFYIASVEAINDIFGDLPDNVSIGIANVLEILLNYVLIVSDPKMVNKISKPEYEPAIESYLYLLLSISALISIYKYENKHYEQKINTLLQYCNYYTKELEEFVETMEIEADPEDMKRLEKIKMA